MGTGSLEVPVLKRLARLPTVPVPFFRRDAKGTGPCFRPSFIRKNTFFGRTMDQSPNGSNIILFDRRFSCFVN